MNGVYTFILPDVYAWCQHLFQGQINPKGLLNDGEVSCSILEDGKELLVNRSPHLYVNEHCIRNNKVNEKTYEWFLGKGVYTSIHDMISKQLFFDVDGDIALVIDNQKLIKIAKKTTENYVPLDFKLSKAEAQEINNSGIYSTYSESFKANIGTASNRITKILNDEDRNIELVAKICWINNMEIDYAKTNWKQPLTNEIKKELKVVDKKRLPYFFAWAKDKNKESLALPNKNSLVDQMALSVDDKYYDEIENKIIPEKDKYGDYNFDSIEDFDINTLLINTEIKITKELTYLFEKLSTAKHGSIVGSIVSGDMDFKNNYIEEEVKNKMFEYCKLNNIEMSDALDMCARYTFEKDRCKDGLFTIFGDEIVNRLENKFPELLHGRFKRCDVCGCIIENSIHNKKYCDTCSNNKKKKNKAIREMGYREKQK